MRRLALILLSLIALVNLSCERRELVELSNTHYVRVYIKEDIKNVTTGFHPNAQNRPAYNQPDILRLLLAELHVEPWESVIQATLNTIGDGVSATISIHVCL